MLVSLVIINYNYGAYLAQAIDSALNQTYPDIEVIVIDDGSTDNSTAIIKSYTDRIIPILKENTGQVSCANLALEMCQGKIVIFLDSDDILFEYAAALHVKNFCNPAVVKSCGYLEVVDVTGKPDGRMIPNRLSPSGNYRDLTLAKGLGMYRASYTSGNAWAKHFLDKVMPLPADDPISCNVGVDGYLTSADALLGDIESIHRPIGQYRVHGKNGGPINFRFDANYMRTRLQCRYKRIQYAEQVASQFGMQFDINEFRKINDWQLTLLRELLVLIEGTGKLSAFSEFVASPFYQYGLRLSKAAVVSLLFALIRALPRTQALRLARYMLVRRRRSELEIATRT